MSICQSFRTAAVILLCIAGPGTALRAETHIRINQLGYLPGATKVAVAMTDAAVAIPALTAGFLPGGPLPVEGPLRNGPRFDIVDVFSGEVVWSGRAETPEACGRWKTFRLDFSDFQTAGTYRIRFADGQSEVFPVDGRVYDGTADFVLNYMRQQRCGWNPFLRDSCHVKDAYIVYHPTKDGQRIDVTGGWHDASDCLQYTTTSANAIYQMLFAYTQNPGAFADRFATDGTPGANGIPDIVDEIRWGLDWLDRMNPAPGEFYNQIADDRDHVGMRLPKDDPADYGWGPGNGRPVYFCSGEPQMRGRKTGRMNETTGVASTTGKFAADFAFGAEVLAPFYPELAERIGAKAADAWQAGLDKPGFCQTASVLSPYIYEESNWVDDMELAAVEMYRRTGKRRFLRKAAEYGRQEPVTPWMGADTARHYEWYPFMNMGHYRLAAASRGRIRKEFIANMKEGIDRVWQRAQRDPFRNGIPAIWCSNNLTVAMLTQCILYRQLTGDRQYEKMEGALRDWLFGCNPWGVSMVVELPLGGVYPLEPHSFMINEHVGNTTGGLVDGPVYDTIFGSLRGVHLDGGNDYARFQPGRRVYHDCTHDYSTNEPTMDGTASLTFPLSFYEQEGHAALPAVPAAPDRNVYSEGGIIRTDPSAKRISLVFTAADKADGAPVILRTLRERGVRGAFFFTGEFFETFPEVIRQLVAEGHYVGSHSYGHLLYNDWSRRDSLLVTKEQFQEDLIRSYRLLSEAGIRERPRWFIPPYEHYNAEIASWARQMGLQIVNYTPGTTTNGDYTTPDMAHYYSSDKILARLREIESRSGLNGYILLIHLGTVPERTDKFYDRLGALMDELSAKGYTFVPLETALTGA